jgi:hypothetical protein
MSKKTESGDTYIYLYQQRSYSKTADNIFKIFQPTPRNSKNYHRPHHPTILGRTSALFPAMGGSPRHAPRSFLHSTSARFGAPEDHEK